MVILKNWKCQDLIIGTKMSKQYYNHITQEINRKYPDTVLLVRHGSHAYGTNVASSDLDIRGIFIPTRQQIFGFSKPEQYESKTPDLQIFEISKFFRLAAKANPNIFEVLFCDNTDILSYEPDFWHALKAKRDLFLSKRVAKTYLGYATQIIHRIGKSDIPDYKDGMHLIRLMRMGTEILTEGIVRVYRPDASELLDIRSGKWPMAKILSTSLEYEAKIQELKEKSSLPDEPDMVEIEKLLIQLTESHLYQNKAALYY